MGEEFGVEVCSGGNWYNNWNSSINLFASSPCSSAINETGGNFGIWPSHHLHHDPNLFINSTTTTNTQSSSDDNSAGSASIANGLMTSSLHDWTTDINNQNHLVHTDNGRSVDNYSHLLQQTGLDCSTQMNTSPFTGLSNGFPLNSDDSYSLYTSSLLQTLFDTDSNNDQSQQEITNYSSDIFNSLNEILPATNSPMMINSSSSSSSLAKQHHDEFNSNRVFVSSTQSQNKSHFLSSSFNTTKPNRHNFTTKHHSAEEVGDKDSVAKKTTSEPATKRARIETPSPLPTFKVRKEKLGDRITALQQLVSPFGKTDTASVLQEAIEYIKFLHDQASALSSPYFKNGSPPLMKRQQTKNDKMKEQEGLNKDLKSRGLCLVPISSTFPVATETSSDFWTPTFGGTFN